MRNHVLSKITTSVAGGLLLGIAAAPALGQVASGLIWEDSPIPGLPGQTTTAINNSAVNKVGGYSFTVNGSDGTTTFSHIWGNAAGGAGTVMRTEGTYGSLVQTSFESFFGMSNAGGLSYSAVGTGGPVDGFDSVWLNDTPVAVEGLPHPSLPGQYWRFASRPGVTTDGVPYFVGGLTDTPGGSTQNYGLFYGTTGTPILLGGDVVPNLPQPLGTSSSISFDYRYSALGTNHFVEATMANLSSTDDNAMVMNGAGLMLGGGLAQENQPVPAAIGGLPGELWDNFDYLGITESGQYLMTGDTSADSTMDEYILIDGQIAMREGEMVSGYTINGAIEGAFMNETGDWAAIWDVDTPGGNVEALLYNGLLVLLEGDAVDWNGDGVIDENDNNGVLANFTGISSLTLGEPHDGDLVDIYFTADVDFYGTPSSSDDLEAGFRFTVPEPSTFGLIAVVVLLLRRRR